jgi:hypothetical protein
VIRRRIEATAARIGVIIDHLQLLARAEAERGKRDQQAEQALHWQSFERLRRHPTEENANAAKRPFMFLTKRRHPDHGGTYYEFLRVKMHMTRRSPFGDGLPRRSFRLAVLHIARPVQSHDRVLEQSRRAARAFDQLPSGCMLPRQFRQAKEAVSKTDFPKNPAP